MLSSNTQMKQLLPPAGNVQSEVEQFVAGEEVGAMTEV